MTKSKPAESILEDDTMTEKTDVIIVGTGAAGLFCALSFPEEKHVLMITKRKADESDSFLAQGGICMLRGEKDYANYFEDTMRAGHYVNDEKAVDLMIRSSNSIIRELIRLGVKFEKKGNGDLDFTKEGAHSQARILFHEDITGKEITSTLLARVRERENVTILEDTTMLDIIEKDNVCGGIVASAPDGGLYTIMADYVVLACGGIGGLYKNSTNFPHLTGDALAIAMRHGVKIEHLNYVQIHPTTLYSKDKGRRFLISESVRGEGALLYGKDMKRFTDELQPRDVVTKAIEEQMAKDGTDHVWEDLRPIGEAEILKHFPNIYHRCLEEGYDVLKEPIPVVPAQHYHMGGIAVDLSSQTSMEGLFAVGEVSCNGVHGRNRLASNSLLESLVFARKAADEIVFGSGKREVSFDKVDLKKYSDQLSLFDSYKDMVLEEIQWEDENERDQYEAARR